MEPIRVLLAEDHGLVRAGMRALLDGLPGIQVVAEASDGREAIKLIESHQPDVVLMDIGMPNLNGLEATARLAREHPQTRVVMLSVHASEEYVLRALRAGAAGYLLKDSGPDDLERAVRSAAQGRRFFSPAVSQHTIDDYLLRTGGGPASPYERLTPRQREILQLIAEGRTTQEISRDLDISVKTVETHRAQLMHRLKIHDVPGLVKFAIRVGIVSSDDV